MKLNSIKLHNFRCFEELDVQFHPELTVIVGTNGSGKSTVLDAAAIAVGTFPSSFNGISNYGIKKEDARIMTFELGDSLDTQSIYPVEITARGNIEGKEITWDRVLTSKNGRCLSSSAKEIAKITRNYQERMMKGDSSVILPLAAYYGTGRLWLQHKEKKEDILLNSSRTNGYIDCLDSAANDKLIMNWFSKMTSKKLQKKTSTAGFDAVVMAIEKCISLLINDNDVSVSYNFDNNDLDIQYKQDGHSVVIPLSRMSDGYKCTISLITDIAYRMAQLNPQLMDKVLETDGVVIIDEIDLHLHPEWQKRVLGDLTKIFPNIQFIVSTHAASVINSVKSENIVMLEDYEVNFPIGEVYGKDTNTIINGIMGSQERPTEVLMMFKQFYDFLSEGKIQDAKDIILNTEFRFSRYTQPII